MDRLLKALPHYLAMKKALEEEKRLTSNLFSLLEVIEENERDPHKKTGYKAAINEAIQKITHGK